jgi:hypothetical protein
VPGSETNDLQLFRQAFLIKAFLIRPTAAVTIAPVMLVNQCVTLVIFASGESWISSTAAHRREIFLA